MRKINKTSGIIRDSYRKEDSVWWVIVQIAVALAVMGMILKWIIDNG